MIAIFIVYLLSFIFTMCVWGGGSEGGPQFVYVSSFTFSSHFLVPLDYRAAHLWSRWGAVYTLLVMFGLLSEQFLLFLFPPSLSLSACVLDDEALLSFGSRAISEHVNIRE